MGHSAALLHSLTWLVLFCLGYNSTEAFNDRRLVDIARLVPFGPLSGQNTSQDDSSLPILNTAVCDPQTSMTADSSSLDVTAPADDELVLTDLKLGVSVPVSLAAGLSLTNPVTEAEPIAPKLQTPVDQPKYSTPPGVNPDALNALEMLLRMWNFVFFDYASVIIGEFVFRKINYVRYSVMALFSVL